MVTTRPPKTIVKPTALGPVANTDTKLLIYSLFQQGRVLAQDGMLPTGGFAITIAAGWFLTRNYTERELVDGSEPRWFNYGAWRFFIQFVSPLAVAAIIIAVLFFGVDFS